MASKFNSNEPIIEYELISDNISGIRKNQNSISYILSALSNTWVFPWKYKKVSLNINKICIPDNLVGIISTVPNKDNRLKVETKVSMFHEDFYTLKVRARGLFPKRIIGGEDIAILHMVLTTDCHVVKNPGMRTQ